MEDGLAPSPGASPENPTKEVRFIELIQHRGQMWGIRGVGVGGGEYMQLQSSVTN